VATPETASTPTSTLETKSFPKSIADMFSTPSLRAASASAGETNARALTPDPITFDAARHRARFAQLQIPAAPTRSVRTSGLNGPQRVNRPITPTPADHRYVRGAGQDFVSGRMVLTWLSLVPQKWAHISNQWDNPNPIVVEWWRRTETAVRELQTILEGHPTGGRRKNLRLLFLNHGLLPPAQCQAVLSLLITIQRMLRPSFRD
jgi:hypothetical protein